MGKVNWFWLTKTVEKLKSSTLQPAETAVEAQRAGAEPRLDALETKVNEIITKLKAAGIIL